ncbi:MAG: helix-turn-helix domain-containing protein [Chloroflexota bacterium]|nr:helix-turn-helix domain-containing protein [Chloroflexota bacterium]
MRDDEALERSSGNIFADLGLPDAELALAKAQVVLQINAIVEQNGWTDIDAAEILGISAADFVTVSEGATLSVFSYEDFALLRERLKAAAAVGSHQAPTLSGRTATVGVGLPLAAGSGSIKSRDVSFD